MERRGYSFTLVPSLLCLSLPFEDKKTHQHPSFMLSPDWSSKGVPWNGMSLGGLPAMCLKLGDWLSDQWAVVSTLLFPLESLKPSSSPSSLLFGSFPYFHRLFLACWGFYLLLRSLQEIVFPFCHCPFIPYWCLSSFPP